MDFTRRGVRALSLLSSISRGSSVTLCVSAPHVTNGNNTHLVLVVIKIALVPQYLANVSDYYFSGGAWRDLRTGALWTKCDVL